MIFWLVSILEISYGVIIYWRILVFLEDFLKIMFFPGEIFEFPQFFFCLKTLFKVNDKAIVWHPPCLKFECANALSFKSMTLLFFLNKNSCNLFSHMGSWDQTLLKWKLVSKLVFDWNIMIIFYWIFENCLIFYNWN